MYLLNFSWKAQEALWEMIERHVLVVLSLEADDMARLRSGAGPRAEREKIRRIFTLDRRDFEVYRPSRIGRFTLLPS